MKKFWRNKWFKRGTIAAASTVGLGGAADFLLNEAENLKGGVELLQLVWAAMTAF